MGGDSGHGGEGEAKRLRLTLVGVCLVCMVSSAAFLPLFLALAPIAACWAGARARSPVAALTAGMAASAAGILPPLGLGMIELDPNHPWATGFAMLLGPGLALSVPGVVVGWWSMKQAPTTTNGGVPE